MVGPNYKVPEPDLPNAYREAAVEPDQGSIFNGTTSSDIRWWRALGDAQLAALVEKAVSANYSVAVAGARLREARAARQGAQSILYPQLSLGASALRFRASEATIGLPGVDLEDGLFQLGFDASWVVDVFGGARRGIESARAIEQASAADRRAVVLMVAAETARAYLELRGVQRQLQIELEILGEQQLTLAVTENRLASGLSSELEVLRARTEVEATAAEIPPLQQASRQYIHLISTLLGLEPTALSAQLEPPRSIPPAPIQIGVGIPSDLLRRRPDVQRAERRLAAATAQVGVAMATLFPRFVLGGSAGVQSRDTGDLFNGNSTDPSSDFYIAGPVINWTLFDAGRRQAGVQFAEAQVDAVKAEYQEAVLRAFREVESSLVAVDRTRARVSDLERLAASARESADIARRDYERGILDQLTVLDAQRQSNRAHLLLSQGEVTLMVNVITLYKALGGGWEVAEPAFNPRSADRKEGDIHEND